MRKFFNKPTNLLDTSSKGKYEYLFLRENPFPMTAVVNKESDEKKINGSIYEPSIREKEYIQLVDNFIKSPLNKPDHLRLGLINDQSFVGRGNGKSSFIINMVNSINKEFSLDISDGVNKCFAVNFAPESGGKTKHFDKFIYLLFESIIRSNIIEESLAMLRIDAILSLYNEKFIFDKEFSNDLDVIKKLNDNDWFNTHKLIDKNEVTKKIYERPLFNHISPDFPLSKNKNLVLKPLVTQNDFKIYFESLKKSEERMNFIFNDLVIFFIESGFNGSFIFVDDFERIPEFQSTIQKKDFFSQLRTILYDGLYMSAKIGFYNFIFSLHAGVPRIIKDEWSTSGMEQRVPLSPSFSTTHLIVFDKISEDDVEALIVKYLNEYRTENFTGDKLYPFSKESVKIIGNGQEMNASKILKLCYELIEHLINNNLNNISESVVSEFLSNNGVSKVEVEKQISKIETTNLMDKFDR